MTSPTVALSLLPGATPAVVAPGRPAAGVSAPEAPAANLDGSGGQAARGTGRASSSLLAHARRTPRFAWRVADMRKPSTGAESRDYRRGVCSECGEPVWHSPENSAGRVIVCWPCEGATRRLRQHDESRGFLDAEDAA